jgi:DNA polymerase-3 subunit gamma/tau
LLTFLKKQRGTSCLGRKQLEKEKSVSELALYRKWRSKNFDELVGQPHITQTLHNAVASGRIAHAYLFCGPRGTGKTSTAKILAKALNCQKGPTPNPCG